MSRVLVTYATTYGSTREVAEAVAATLQECGLNVTVEAMPNVSSLDAYETVIAGIPIYAHHLHKDAQQFLTQQRDALTGRQVVIFALGPIMMDTKEVWLGARKELDKELTHYPWLRPVAVEMFGGKFDPKILHFPEKLFMGMFGPSDLRNWEAIKVWTQGLVERLQQPHP